MFISHGSGSDEDNIIGISVAQNIAAEMTQSLDSLDWVAMVSKAIGMPLGPSLDGRLTMIKKFESHVLSCAHIIGAGHTHE